MEERARLSSENKSLDMQVKLLQEKVNEAVPLRTEVNSSEHRSPLPPCVATDHRSCTAHIDLTAHTDTTPKLNVRACL